MELKNCPFCGGIITANTLLGQTAFSCKACFAVTEFRKPGMHVDQQRKAWNTRHIMDEKRAIEQNERMRAWFKKRTGLDAILLNDHMQELDRMLNTRTPDTGKE